MKNIVIHTIVNLENDAISLSKRLFKEGLCSKVNYKSIQCISSKDEGAILVHAYEVDIFTTIHNYVAIEDIVKETIVHPAMYKSAPIYYSELLSYDSDVDSWISGK